MYLDLGILPARFQIKKYKLNFLHYILNQKEDTLIHRFFLAQLDNPTKGDWVSEVKGWIIDYEIGTSFEEVLRIKKSRYEKIVHEKVNIEAFQYLKSKIKSKGSEINYGDRLEIQSYLRPNQVLNYQEQTEIFSYRAEMNDLKINFKGLKEQEYCICKTVLNNSHLFQCKLLNNGENTKYQYEDLLNGTLHQQKHIFSILKKNLANYRKITLAA